MRLRSFAALLAMALLAAPVWAQEQRGSIEGVVKDSSGAVLPGATVEAKSAGSGVLSTTSDAQGNFRFPSVLPGVYEVSANLSGFKAAKVGDVEVKLGSIKSVEFSLQLASMTEQVTVTAESPIVDVKNSGKSTNIRAEQVEMLPHNRDFTSLVVQAPGVNQETKSAGIMIDGAAAAENRYVVDGIETTEILGGLSGKNVITDFVEEVQVKSTGYPAEFGGSTGGVINVLTKSGTNNMTGSLYGYFQGSSLAGANNPTLRAVFGHPDQAEYHTFPKDNNQRFEPAASVGGPVMQNKMWYFGAYNPALTTIKRHVDATTSGIASANTHDTTQKQQVQYITANVTNQFGNKLRTRVAFNNSWNQSKGLLAATSGSEAVGTDYTKGTNNPNWALSGTADYTLSPNLVISGRGGRYYQNSSDFNVNNVVQYSFINGTTNIGQAGVPGNLQQPAGYANVPSNSGILYDKRFRNYMQIDATYFGHAHGTHQVKGGFQYDNRGNNVISGQLKNIVELNWGATPLNASAPVGQYGWYDIRSNTAAPTQGFITQGNVTSNVYGLFVQDTWNFNNRLTINAGVRTENENLPAYATGAGIQKNPISFGFADKTAPRLGFAYDLRGDGKQKVYGSWGIFYDIFKLNLARGSFGGEKWVNYYYTLDTPNWDTIDTTSDCVVKNTCPGTFIQSTDFRAVSVEPGLDVEQPGQLKPMRTQELSFGYEKQLNNVMALTLRYVHKQLNRAIDDIGDLNAAGEAYIIANPGEGLVSQADISTGTSIFRPQYPGAVFPSTAVLITQPKASRKYDGVEASLQKRLSNNWQLMGSYLYSKDRGNYSGLSSSDENGRDNPNNSRDFDYPAMTWDQTGHVIDGVFDTDRTHQIKLQGLYEFKFGTSVGVNQYAQSGTPLTRQVPIISPSNYPIRYLGRDSDGRTPFYTQTDLYVQHMVKVGGAKRLIVSLNVLNLWDQRTAVNKVTTMRRTGAIPNQPGYYQEAAFYAGQLNFDQLIQKAVANGFMTLNPQFLMVNQYQDPIQARVGVKFTF
jgi:outer membrane receptor protein involved in Fe transport